MHVYITKICVYIKRIYILLKFVYVSHDRSYSWGCILVWLSQDIP